MEKIIANLIRALERQYGVELEYTIEKEVKDEEVN